MFGFRDWNWHQKLTVSVMTPDGLKTGSAVSAVELTKSPRWWGVGDSAGASTTGLLGEAVTVDLGHDRFLFVLLDKYSLSTARMAFFPSKRAENRDENNAIYDRLEALRATINVPREKYPLFVTFEDIHNPASVKRVDPDNLEAAFGPGFHLSAVTIAITDEPVTKGRVEEVLPWLERVGRERPTLIPNPPRLSTDARDPDIQYLTPRRFSTELYK
ncbi:hypothetical protein [Rhizobium paknamense]|uniref:Uncharacterized protein n=1 Tax=Rhizobium paknamense TaxID=1206817 RepID=A0ABU0IFZ3_9HYPH|nr:hypothetical protein [Rhizobium paknamense]MDQ0457169.1 hypothetical protein [Rhizobium paknamense]